MGANTHSQPHKVMHMTWMDYVTDIAKGDTQTTIGYKAGVSGASVSRWKDSAPKPWHVAAFARAYKRPVLEAFVAAGFLSEEEARQRPIGKPNLSTLSNDDLVAEVGRRLHVNA